MISNNEWAASKFSPTANAVRIFLISNELTLRHFFSPEILHGKIFLFYYLNLLSRYRPTVFSFFSEQQQNKTKFELDLSYRILN